MNVFLVHCQWMGEHLGWRDHYLVLNNIVSIQFSLLNFIVIICILLFQFADNKDSFQKMNFTFFVGHKN